MEQIVERMMEKYGRNVTAEHSGVKTGVKAFLQPVNAKVERLAMVQMGPLGRESRGQFVYMGPAKPALEPDDRLETDGVGYQVRSAQLVYAGGQPVYCWALCVKEGGELTWQSSD